MKSIFNPADNNEMVERINKLNAGSKPQWGKMSVAQMLAHLQVPIRVAFGEQKLKRGLIGILFGGIARKKMTSEIPFSKNLPTAPSFVVREERNFEEEKSKVLDLVKRFAEKGTAVRSGDPHPFFGKSTTEQWDTLGWKHLDHH